MVCRRPPWETSEHSKQSARQQALTVVFGLCLIAALARVVQLGLLDSATHGQPRDATRGLPTAQESPNDPNVAAATQDAGAAHAEQTAIEEATQEQVGPAELPETAPEPTGPRLSPEALAQARKQVRVVMYASPWCYICDRARDQLQAHDVQLVEHDIDNDPQAARRLAKRNPSATVPTFEIGGDTLIGYNPWQLQDAVDALAVSMVATQQARSN